MFSVQAAVAIPVLPNGQGTSSHWTLPLTDLRPKKGIRTSRAFEKVGVKSLPDEIVTDLDPSIRVNLVNSIIFKVQKYRAPDLRCNR